MSTLDQATELRRLALLAAREDRAPTGPAPRLVVVSGGCGRVGSTAVAINLSVAFSDLGLRTVLVDAAEDACVAERCGLEPVATVDDILTARRDIHEVLVRGLSGVQVAPGDIDTRNRSEAAGQRLVTQLHALGRHADLVLVDAGVGAGKISEVLWSSADDVLLTTVVESQATMDTYSLVKKLRKAAAATNLHLIVNQENDERAARELFARVELSCAKFLDIVIHWACRLPRDPRFAQCDHSHRPLITRFPEAAAASRLSELAQTMNANQRRRRREDNEPIHRRAA